MSSAAQPVLVVEDDPFLRIVQVVLDPRTTHDRMAAFANFFAHDLPDFEGWCADLRLTASALYPAEVRLVSSQEEMRAQLPGADILVVEGLTVGKEELELSSNLTVVQKYGTILRTIDAEACQARGVRLATIQRRANVACAEQTLALMLALAKKLNRIDGLISTEQLSEAGYSPTTFDRRHTANSGWARISGLQMLYESTLGIVGMGEIGRELALRASAFGMRVLYYQRNPLSADDEERYHAKYATLETLLGESDWVSIQLPRGEATRGLIGKAQLGQMKQGASLVNTAQAYHVDRDALIESLTSGHLGGFALDTLYEEPGRADDELLAFDNVILTPHTAAQPRFNALNDFRDMIKNMAGYFGG